MKKNNEIAGFTLIELAIVIAIIAFIISAVVFATMARIDASRIYSTKSKMQIIADALENYVQLYGHLPCPADPTVFRTDPNYGWATGTNTGTCSKAVNIGTLTSGSRIVRGMVPFKNLFPELDSQATVDGWGNRFTYIVTERYTSTLYYSGVEPNFYHPSTEQGKTYVICRRNNGSCASSTYNLVVNNSVNKRGDVAYILFSSGPTGHASHKDKNPTTIQSNNLGLSVHDKENGDFTSDGNTYVQNIQTSDYQDILIFRNRWQLKQYLNGN